MLKLASESTFLCLSFYVRSKYVNSLASTLTICVSHNPIDTTSKWVMRSNLRRWWWTRLHLYYLNAQQVSLYKYLSRAQSLSEQRQWDCTIVRPLCAESSLTRAQVRSPFWHSSRNLLLLSPYSGVSKPVDKLQVFDSDRTLDSDETISSSYLFQALDRTLPLSFSPSLSFLSGDDDAIAFDLQLRRKAEVGCTLDHLGRQFSLTSC